MIFYAISAQILVFMFVAFLIVLGVWLVTAVRWMLSGMEHGAAHQTLVRASASEVRRLKQVGSSENRLVALVEEEDR